MTYWTEKVSSIDTGKRMKIRITAAAIEPEADHDYDRNILSKLQFWHCPDLGELPFKALMIDDGLESSSQQVVLLLTVAVCFIIVIGAKLVFGDWGTAWNVGCFLVALATLSRMWVTHTGD
jgi:hypothetical protein